MSDFIVIFPKYLVLYEGKHILVVSQSTLVIQDMNCKNEFSAV